MKQSHFSTRARLFGLFWAATIGLLYALHFVHLRADFPNFSPWMDYAKYTDEGWYGSAAVRYWLDGTWRVTGDFNPAAALPVLPLLEAVLFRFTGVSLLAARVLMLAIFGGDLLLSYALMRACVPGKRWPALAAVTLAAGNAFLFAFSRLAILELLLVFWTLLAWLLLLRFAQDRSMKARGWLLVAVGLLLCVAALTKTTAVFLFPAAFLLLAYAVRFRLRVWIRSAVVVTAAGAVPGCAYYVLLVRPRALADFHYLFAANQIDAPAHLADRAMEFWYAVHGVFWIDVPITLLALAFLALSFFPLRVLWRNPLFAASWAAIAGYVVFIGSHNSMQPRYYQVVAFPLLFIVSIGTAALLRHPQPGWRWRGVPVFALLVFTAGYNLRLIASSLLHPTYDFLAAANGITRYIDQHPDGNRLLLSISGANITLITHLPSICDDFGTYDLRYRIHVYRPGWYAAWNEIDPGTLEDLRSQYAVSRAAEFHAFDDEDRDTLILYRLTPLPLDRQSYNDAEERAANAAVASEGRR